MTVKMATRQAYGEVLVELGHEMENLVFAPVFALSTPVLSQVHGFCLKSGLFKKFLKVRIQSYQYVRCCSSLKSHL